MNKPQCNYERLKQIDSTAIKVIGIGKGGRPYPTNQAEVGPFCRETDRLLKLLETFANECLIEQARSFGRIQIYSIRRSYRFLCQKKSTRKQKIFLQNARCLSNILKESHCLKPFADKIKKLIQYDIGNEKFKYVCCGNIEALKCGENAFTNPCVSEEGKEIAMEFLRGIGGDSANFACGDYNESTDRCDHLPPLPKSKFNKTIQLPEFDSFLLAELYLLESVGGSFDFNEPN